MKNGIKVILRVLKYQIIMIFEFRVRLKNYFPVVCSQVNAPTFSTQPFESGRPGGGVTIIINEPVELFPDVVYSFLKYA